MSQEQLAESTSTAEAARQRLDEAAIFYQSLTDDVFVEMSSYFKKQFPRFDASPENVREGIRQIRKHLGQQLSWEREVIRIESDLIRRCQEHSDIPIYVSVEEWAENLVGDATQYFLEEYKMQFEIGTKVKRIPLLNEITEGAIIRYGVVSANKLAYIVNRNPFDEAGIHDYKTNRPKQEDFASGEAFMAAVREYDKNEIERQARIVALAEMLFISWRDCSGKQIAEGWMRPNQLQEYTEDDAKVDADLAAAKAAVTA